MKFSTLTLRVLVFSVLAAVGLVVSADGLHAGDWPTFRGAERTAVAPDTGLLTSWPEGGPKLLWEAKGTGRGYSSLAIVGDRIYTLGDRSSLADGDNSEFLLCFSREDGSPIWKLKTGSPWDQGAPDWQGSRSTPTVDDDRVYVLTPHGDLICASTDGVEKWRRNLKSDFGGNKGDGWGYGESVTVDDDRLICTPGGGKNTMVALNKLTGDLVWSAVREGDRGAGHASVVISDVGGTRVYVQTTASGALGVRADDGKLLWSYEIERTTAVIPTPIVRGDLAFFSAGYKSGGGALLRQVAGANGDVTVEEIYPVNNKLANKHGGIVLIGDHLYGDTDSRGLPFCAELMTGNVVWQSRGSGKGSANVVAADGHLYIRYTDGTLVLVKATPDGYKESGLLKIPGSDSQPSWSHSVVLDEKLYLREGDNLLCYDLRGQG